MMLRLSVRGSDNVDNNDCARMTSKKNKNEREKPEKPKKKKPQNIVHLSIVRVRYILLQLQLPIQRRAVGY
jgi:hypothetical protein